MADAKEFVESYLEHYASQYYDPAKAHEYYLRNRELIGRNVSDLSSDQKDVWQVTKSNIDKAKVTESKTNADKHSADIQQVRMKAQQRRSELQTSIKQLFEKLSNDRKAGNVRTADYVDKALKRLAEQKSAKLAKIAADAKSKIDSLPPLPENSSREDRIKRSEEISKIKGDARIKSSDVVGAIKAQEQDLKKSLSDQRNTASTRDAQIAKTTRESSRANAEKVANDLRSAVDKAKKTYEGLKEQTKAKYEATYQREFEAIKQDEGSSSKG